MRHANFEILEESPKILLIRDLGPWDRHSTVTNDAEWVVEQLVPKLGGRELWYYDSDGRVDKLLVREGRFVGFAPAPMV